jgi:hypothetical protein
VWNNEGNAPRQTKNGLSDGPAGQQVAHRTRTLLPLSWVPFLAFCQNRAKSTLDFADYSDGVSWSNFTDDIALIAKNTQLNKQAVGNHG